jgi:hypothetical protein
MALNEYMRGVLENLIDQAIKLVPTWVNMARNNNTPEFNIQRLDDYILGFSQGSIMRICVSLYRTSLAQDLPPTIMAEVSKTTFRRTREICDAIFNTG